MFRADLFILENLPENPNPRDEYFFLSLSYLLHVSLYLGIAPCQIFQVHIGILTGSIINQILIHVPYFWHFMTAASLPCHKELFTNRLSQSSASYNTSASSCIMLCEQ